LSGTPADVSYWNNNTGAVRLAELCRIRATAIFALRNAISKDCSRRLDIRQNFKGRRAKAACGKSDNRRIGPALSAAAEGSARLQKPSRINHLHSGSGTLTALERRT